MCTIIIIAFSFECMSGDYLVIAVSTLVIASGHQAGLNLCWLKWGFNVKPSTTSEQDNIHKIL